MFTCITSRRISPTQYIHTQTGIYALIQINHSPSSRPLKCDIMYICTFTVSIRHCYLCVIHKTLYFAGKLRKHPYSNDIDDVAGDLDVSKQRGNTSCEIFMSPNNFPTSVPVYYKWCELCIPLTCNYLAARRANYITFNHIQVQIHGSDQILYSSLYYMYVCVCICLNICTDAKLRDQQSDSLSLEDDEYYNSSGSLSPCAAAFLTIALACALTLSGRSI